MKKKKKSKVWNPWSIIFIYDFFVFFGFTSLNLMEIKLLYNYTIKDLWRRSTNMKDRCTIIGGSFCCLVDRVSFDMLELLLNSTKDLYTTRYVFIVSSISNVDDNSSTDDSCFFYYYIWINISYWEIYRE